MVTGIVTLIALAVAVGRFSFGAGDFLAAIRAIAQQQTSGNSLVDGVLSAVNTVKVVNMLNELRGVLRVGWG